MFSRNHRSTPGVARQTAAIVWNLRITEFWGFSGMGLGGFGMGEMLLFLLAGLIFWGLVALVLFLVVYLAVKRGVQAGLRTSGR
ncbi:hypothetical protein [Candidatus Foliamicus sp.]